MRKINYQTLRHIALLALLTASASACKKDTIATNDLGLSSTKSNMLKTQLPVSAPYELVWSDEFTNGLDTTKWAIVTGNTDVNHELQAYGKSNVNVRNGFLNILAEKRSADGREYTSGKITTADKFSIQYGRIEARIKIPYVIGMTPEFSLQGITFPQIGLPASGKIDIMQHINRDPQVLGGIQWENSGHAIYRGSSPEGYYNDYHVYAVEWEPKEIRWYVDGKQFWKANIADNINSTDEFHKPFFLNLNMAVGGDLAGMTIDRNLPTSMVVDYVKVYRSGAKSL